MKHRVVLLHGLYVSKPIMVPLVMYLNNNGWSTLNLDWQPWQRTLEENAKELIPQIREYRDQGEVLHFVGHSMGGLLIRQLWSMAPELFEGSRVATLGTPHNGSEFAKKVYMDMNPFILGQSWQGALDGNAPSFDLSIPVLSVIGDLDIGLGTFMNVFENGARGDGTVSMCDAEWTYATKQVVLTETHIGMLFSMNVFKEVEDWFDMSEQEISELVAKRKKEIERFKSAHKDTPEPDNFKRLGEGRTPFDPRAGRSRRQEHGGVESR